MTVTPAPRGLTARSVRRAIRRHERIQRKAQRGRHGRQRHVRQRPADRGVRRPLPDGEPRACAGDGLRAEGDRGRLGLGLVYKTSFDKANRTSLEGKRGIGLDGALPVFAEIRETLGLPVVTDVHEAGQCARVAEVVDVLQIPAFLCRQTDLLIAAAKTGRVVKVKKGQFLAPWDMQNVVAKITGSGNPQRAGDRARRLVRLQHAGGRHARRCRSWPSIGCPVIFDATHAVQQPGGQGTASGGDRRFVPVLARAAVAVGVAGLFIETHQDPDHAPSDGPNMVPLKEFEGLMRELMAIDAVVKGRK